MREIVLGIWYDVWKLSGWIHVSVNDLCQSSASLHTRIVRHDHSINLVVPFGHHDHISSDKNCRRLFIDRSDFLKQFDFVFMESQTSLPVAAHCSGIVRRLISGNKFALIIIIVSDNKYDCVALRRQFLCPLQI